MGAWQPPRPFPGRPPGSPDRLCRGHWNDSFDLDAVLVVDLLEMDLDELLARGRDVLADMVRPDRQLAVATIDEDRQPDRLGTPEIDESIHRRADRPSRVQDVVDEDHSLAVDPGRKLRALDH